MLRALVAAALLAVLAFPFRQADGQGTSAPSLTGACVRADSMIDLGDVADQPDQPPRLMPSSDVPAFPASLRRPGYSASVSVGFVVNADGKVRPGTVTVLASTDSVLTRWACDAVPRIRLAPAQSHGHAVPAQLVLPFNYRVPSPRSETAAAVISRMYAEYAWETKDDSPSKTEPLFSASSDAMDRYLDEPLIKAVLADRACQKRVQGECNLGFVPMWDSQDPGGATVTVAATEDTSLVRARILYPAQKEARVVTYLMRRTPLGWRIADMSGAEWASLLELLRRPVK